MENKKTYQRARKRVEAKIGFYVHLAVYVGVKQGPASGRETLCGFLLQSF